MGWLRLTLASSARIVAATLALAPMARAQIPVTIEPAEAAPVAPPEAERAPVAPAEAESAPAPASLPAREPGAGRTPSEGSTGLAPAKADRLKQSVAAPEDDEEYYEDEPERPRRSWYGWQTLTADGVSTVVFFAAFNDEDAGGDDTNETLAWAGILGYELAPGIIHFAHRNPGRGFASMGIRLGMPLAGAFLGGAAASGCHGQDCKASGIGVGFLLGMGGAMAIDAALLAFDYPESRAHGASTVPSTLSPLLSLSPKHAFVGVRGAL